MDAFIETVSQILIDWGYPGLFISALLAGSIVPFSSEIVLLGLVKLGLDPTLCLISASLGNTAGGMTCYYMGRLGRIDWIEKYFKVKKEKIDKMQRFLQGKGALMVSFDRMSISVRNRQTGLVTVRVSSVYCASRFSAYFPSSISAFCP